MDLIIFVCHGNICRSPMAEFIAKHLDKDNKYQYLSRAVTYEEYANDMHHAAKYMLSKHDIPFKTHFADRISKSEFQKAKIVFAMDEKNISILKRLFPDEDFSKVRLLNESGIEDPWYTGNFEGVYDQIYSSIVHFLSEN